MRASSVRGRRLRRLPVVVAAALVWSMLSGSVALAAPLTGAVFTTNAACDGTNLNIYGDKADVYLNGGPAHAGAAGLPDGSYYVQVTEPNGAVLGKSLVPVASVVLGKFVVCYQLAAIVLTDSSGYTVAGYDTTSNNGGEYKVWVSTSATFPPNASKTDNFKVRPGDEPPPRANLDVVKFYDANANGLDDDGDSAITGWKVLIKNGIDIIRYTPVTGIIVDPGNYVVSEFSPVEANWFATTDTSVPLTLTANDHKEVAFGNVCVGAGGARTIGYWSNRNGQADFGATPGALLSLVALNLRTAAGLDFNPASYAVYRTWLLSADASNMAYMLSAQLSGMHLNVLSGKVSGAALVYAPGTLSANPLGFATVGALLAEADAALAADGLVLAGHAQRSYQEALKNALDRANNNLTFVQATPCPFSFPE